MGKFVRVRRLAPPHEEPLAWVIRNYYEGICAQRGTTHTEFTLEDLVPKSLNHQYLKRGAGKRFDFDPDIKLLRDLVFIHLRAQPRFYPRGAVALVIEMHTPAWLTLENKVRALDLDNKIKPLIDAVQKAIDHGDEHVWQIHAFKIASRVTRTRVSLFDLGDIIDFWV